MTPPGVDLNGGGRSVWLALEPDPVLAFLHLPGSTSGRGTAVLLCPPFGWEEMCSYRARRTWALALARAGHPAARMTLPACGDSAGDPRDPARLESWTGAVSGAAAWLRDATDASRVAAIGIGLGGMVAYAALSQGAPIDDLVLWAVPSRGRALLREMRAYAEMVAARNPEDRVTQSGPEGASEFMGFVLSDETTGNLEQLELTTLALPHGNGRRALLLGRDGLAVDKRVHEHLERAGVTVTVQDTGDYGAMMAHPQESDAPLGTIAKTISWLSEGAQASPIRRSAPPAARSTERTSIELARDGAMVRETPIRFRGERGELFGVLSESTTVESARLCAVWLNGGALAHTGPNRAWVEVARRWAARGVPTLRVDLHGIGDSDGEQRELVSNPGLYAPERTLETLAILDQLAALGLPDRFVLGGLCSGAYWSLHAALADERIAGTMMINIYAFFWSKALVAERDTAQSLQALRGSGWRRLARRDVTRAELGAAIRSVRPGRLRAGASHPVERAQSVQIELALDQLRDQKTEALMLLSRGEGLHGQLLRQGVLDQLERWPNLVVEGIPSSDHMFRALWLQRHVHASLDRALDRLLAAQGSDRAASRLSDGPVPR